MLFFKTKEEKENLKIQIKNRKEKRKRALQEQREKNKTIRSLYQKKAAEERRLRDTTKLKD